MEDNKKKQELFEDEELGSSARELLKPENLIGPFDSTEEMLKSMWDED